MPLACLIGLLIAQWFGPLQIISVTVFILIFTSIALRRVWPIVVIFGWLVASHTIVETQQQQFLYSQLAGEQRLTVLIDGLPERRERYTRVRLKVYLPDQPKLHQAKIRAYWPRYKPLPLPGSYWNIRIKMKPVVGQVNPGLFDYEHWLFHQKIAATGYITAAWANQRIESCLWCRATIDRWRFKRLERLSLSDLSANARPLVAAMSLGSSSDLTEYQWKLLRETGTVHLMVVSGLHSGIFYGLMLVLLLMAMGLLRKSPGGWRICLWGGMLAAVGYGLASGLGLSVFRSLLMLFLLTLCIVFGKRIAGFDRLFAAAAILLLVNPLAAGLAGFWLSFSAVGIIYWIISGGGRHLSGWRGFVRFQLMLGVALLPMQLLVIGVGPVMAILANLLLVPLVSLLILPLSLVCGLLFEITPLTWLLNHLADFFWWWLELLQGKGLLFASGSFLLKLIGLILVFIALIPLAWQWRGALLISGLLLAFNQQVIKPQQLIVELMDVGHGQALIVRDDKHLILLDTGPALGNFSSAERVLLPYLQARGYSQIDLLVLSHLDMRHVGGAGVLATAMPAKLTLAGNAKQINQKWSLNALPCKTGDSYQLGDIRVSVVLAKTTGSEDKQSCAIAINYGKSRILVMGDLDRVEEKRLLDNFQLTTNDQQLILLPGKQGAKNASSERFVKQINPQIVLISTGFKITNELPDRNVLQRYHLNDAQLFSTACDGMIQLVVDAGGSVKQIATSRLENQYWRLPRRASCRRLSSG
ncbi:DNA internalization-related competence protein ComEC/Rec2 [Pelagibaculum spongiae]|nr:DNA internalization-related competence protein ComEC/Rec2 [Pelagibaculum spongiae]